MKKSTIFMLALLLTACGGGSGSNTINDIPPVNPQIVNDHITTNMVSTASNEQIVRSAMVSYVGERLEGVYDNVAPAPAPVSTNNRSATTNNITLTAFDQRYEIALAKIQQMHETLHEMLNKTLEQLQTYISEHQQAVAEALKLYVDNNVFNAINWDSFNAQDVFTEQSITQESLDSFDENHDFIIIHQNIEDIDFIMRGDAIYSYNNMHFVVENGKVKKITLETTVSFPQAKIYAPDHIFQHKSDNSFNITHFVYEPLLVSAEGSRWYDLTQNETIDETKWIFESDKKLSLEEIKQNLKNKLSEFCPSCNEEKIALFNAKIDSLTEDEVRGKKGANPYDLAIGEKGLVGEMNLTMLGNNVGLQYSDFGYIDGDLAVYDAINGMENNSAYSVFSGGYNSKEIKTKPDEGSVFKGSAVADITKETQTRTYKDNENFDVDISKSYMLTHTDDAKLEFNDGKETLTMNFSKSTENPWYDIVMTSNRVTFSGDDSQIDENFILPDNAKTIEVQENQYNYQIQDFAPRYFGDNGAPTEAISTSTVNNDFDVSELQHVRFTIDSAFGGKLEQQ